MTARGSNYPKAKSLFDRLLKEIPTPSHAEVQWYEFAELVERIIEEENPSAEVLSTACLLTFAYSAPGWSDRIGGALAHVMEIRLVRDQIVTQENLATSNEVLGKRMLLVSVVGLLVAVVGVVATIVAAIRPS
jgi:hypothetical protein